MSNIVFQLHKMSTDELNLSTKKYVKSQPVDFKLIPHYIGILKILFEGRKNENQIFMALSKNEGERIAYQSDKNTTIVAIKRLVVYNLATVAEIKSKGIKKKRWMQRRVRRKTMEKIIELTPLGKELSQLICYKDEYKLGYKKLKDSINQYFKINRNSNTNISNSVFRRRLKTMGWKNNEIEVYDRLEEEILSLEAHLPLIIFNTILARYFRIISHYNQITYMAKEILKRVVMDVITDYVLNRPEGILTDKDYLANTTYRLLAGWLVDHFFAEYTDKYSEDRFIQRECLDLAKILYNILNPEDNFLQNAMRIPASRDPKVNQLIQELETSRK
jgi:hypothetical protein